jgi:excisionase family DNA binding protein
LAVYLNVQRAALRLGVAPHTVRRWTATGFLPCTRTPGGHRRILQADVDELARHIGGSNHLAARLARERELETLLETSIALVSQLELPDLLREIARRLTRLMDCHFCAISAYDPGAETVVSLAEYDDRGESLPPYETYHLSRFPLTRRVIEEQITAVVNANDPAADSSELQDLARDNDQSLLMVPLVYAGRCIGLLELIDHVRERHYAHQELRICTAVAGQAAVALHNAEAFAAAYAATSSAETMRSALATLGREIPELLRSTPPSVTLKTVAELACQICHGASCVVSGGGVSAGHIGELPQDGEGETQNQAGLVAVNDPSGESDVRVVLSCSEPSHEGDAELLGLLAAIAGEHLKSIEGLPNLPASNGGVPGS